MGTLGAETKDNKQQTDWWAVTSNDKLAARKGPISVSENMPAIGGPSSKGWGSCAGEGKACHVNWHVTAPREAHACHLCLLNWDVSFPTTRTLLPGI